MMSQDSKYIWILYLTGKIEAIVSFHISSNPEISVLFLSRQNSNYEKITYTTVFIAAQFTIAKTRKQPKCQSMYEDVRYIYIFI